MLMLIRQVKLFWNDEAGQDAVEYALMLVLVALAIAGATPGISEAVLGVFGRMATALGG